MPCNPLTNLAGCLGSSAGGQVSSTGTATGTASGWDGICQSFAKAAQQLLTSFAKSFSSIPPIDLSYSGIRSVYGLSLEIAAVVAAVLLMVQVIRTAMTHDGSAIVQGLTGIGKAALAFVLILGAAATALRASDELTGWIITRTFGTPQALAGRLGQLATFKGVSPSLLLVLALAGILLTLALWAQLLVRNIAVTVLVAVSPIAAAGQVAHASQQWWRKLVRVTIQLIVLKPAVALIFAVGLTLPSTSGGVEKLLTGLLVLLLAAIAWPAMARASAVVEVYLAGGKLADIRGGERGYGGSPAGVNPAELSRVAEARTMTAVHEAHARPASVSEQAPPRWRRALALDASSRTGGPKAARPQALGPGAAALSPGQGSDQPAGLPAGDVAEPAASAGPAASVPANSVPANSAPANSVPATGAPASWRNP
jgi:hypothetical protein